MTLSKRDHWACNCRSVKGNLYSPSDADGSWRGSQYYAQTCSQILKYCCSDKSWGQPGKPIRFQTYFMSNLVLDEFNNADGFWRRFQDHAYRLTSSIICDKSWGQPGKHVTLSDTFHVQPCPRRSQTFTVLRTLLLRQELGATRKAHYAFRHMSCPTLSMMSQTDE